MSAGGLYAIRLGGTGGQGLVLAGIILAEAAALYEGRHTVQTQAYGPESRGGASKSEVLISDEEIDYPKAGDVDLFLAGYRALRQIQPNAPIVVLMEDLDEILKGKSSAGESRILNLLDGVESTHNVVFLATTNYVCADVAVVPFLWVVPLAFKWS